MRIVAIGFVIGLGLAAPAWAQSAAEAPKGAELSQADIKALLESARETARATRESVDYARVVPDILQQILAKLDKLEDKLDKLENAVKAQNKRR